MIVFLTILWLLVGSMLIFVAGIELHHGKRSITELEREKQAGSHEAARVLEREELLRDIQSLQRALQAILLVFFVLLSVAAFGWLTGIIVAVIMALEYGAIAKLKLFAARSQKLYQTYEKDILQFVKKFSGPIRLIRSVSQDLPQAKTVDSREELSDMIRRSGTVLSSDEKNFIAGSLTFEATKVGTIMTPRGVIDSIDAKEMLGPLVLSDLHKTGHSRFPVTEGDIDHVVGVLYIQDLLSLHNKRSLTAGRLMESHVYYIHEDQTLGHALAAFLRTHHHLFVVVNEFRETVGILCLEDVIETLLGRKIIDEFDAHDDLRAVAARNPRGNNVPPASEDV